MIKFDHLKIQHNINSITIYNNVDIGINGPCTLHGEADCDVTAATSGWEACCEEESCDGWPGNTGDTCRECSGEDGTFCPSNECGGELKCVKNVGTQIGHDENFDVCIDPNHEDWCCTFDDDSQDYGHCYYTPGVGCTPAPSSVPTADPTKLPSPNPTGNLLYFQ